MKMLQFFIKKWQLINFIKESDAWWYSFFRDNKLTNVDCIVKVDSYEVGVLAKMSLNVGNKFHTTGSIILWSTILNESIFISLDLVHAGHFANFPLFKLLRWNQSFNFFNYALLLF